MVECVLVVLVTLTALIPLLGGMTQQGTAAPAHRIIQDSIVRSRWSL